MIIVRFLQRLQNLSRGNVSGILKKFLTGYRERFLNSYHNSVEMTIRGKRINFVMYEKKNEKEKTMEKIKLVCLPCLCVDVCKTNSYSS